jgi:hypothetical protein
MINVSENEWMSIILKSEIRIEFVKVYSMRSKKRELIDETFDKLHQQNKMHWTIESTVHEVSIFVVWRQIFDDDKMSEWWFWNNQEKEKHFFENVNSIY